MSRVRSWRWPWLLVVGVLVWLLATPAGRGRGSALFASLRIARPEAVKVTIPAFSGPTGSHRIQDAVAAMVADSVRIVRASVDTSVASVSDAQRLAGFTAALPTARHDPPHLEVETAREVVMRVDRQELRTILAEAGRSQVAVPASVDHGTLRMMMPAAIRATYGHCPSGDSTSLQNQLAGPPPPTADNGDCIVLVQRRAAATVAPPGLDLAQLVGVALEVAGMSPQQASAFRSRIDDAAALSLTLPRFLRSADTVRVNAAPAVLLNTAGRRGPTYVLVWAANGIVYSLLGYGSAADAVPLAASVR